MSGWRKLLTPRTEKYLPHESNRSNLTQSKFGKDSSLKSSGKFFHVFQLIYSRPRMAQWKSS